jgi:hypothetical protein
LSVTATHAPVVSKRYAIRKIARLNRGSRTFFLKHRTGAVRGRFRRTARVRQFARELGSHEF